MLLIKSSIWPQINNLGLKIGFLGQICIAADLDRAGSPLRLGDLETQRAKDVEPLSLRVGGHMVYNLPPPTQGLASLMLLGIYERLGIATQEGFAHIHRLVEATNKPSSSATAISATRHSWHIRRRVFSPRDARCAGPPSRPSSRPPLALCG